MTMTLANVAYILGGLMTAGSVLAIIVPSTLRQALLAFPRNKPAALILTAIDMVWVAALVLDIPMGRFEHLKPAIYVVAPLSFFLMVRYMDELLAARALGGLLLLVAAPVLDAARWHDSNWRFVITVWAYLAVVAGMALVLAPFYFRRWSAWWVAQDARLRAGGVVKLALGLFILSLAQFVY